MRQIKVRLTDSEDEITVIATKSEVRGSWTTPDTRAKVGEPVIVTNGLGLRKRAVRIPCFPVDELNVLALLGTAIQEARESKGLTQAELAEKLGISPKYIQVVEQGRKNITINQVQRILETIGCKRADIRFR